MLSFNSLKKCDADSQKKFLSAITCGASGITWNNKHLDNSKWFIWAGKIPSKIGWYVMPNAVPAALAKQNGAQMWGSGYDSSAVGAYTCVWTEIDCDPESFKAMPQAEQGAFLLSLINDHGLPEPTAVVWSGGKSLHIFWAIKLVAPAPAAQTITEAWFDAMTMLCVLTGGDTAVVRTGHKMRAGGAKDGKREQPIVHFQNNPLPYDLFDLRDSLLRTCKSTGRKNLKHVEREFEALRISYAAHKQAAQLEDDTNFELAKKLQAEALAVRKKRTVTPALVKLQIQASRKQRGFASGRFDSDQIFELTDGTKGTATDLFATHGEKWKSDAEKVGLVLCPWHSDKSQSSSLHMFRSGLILHACKVCGSRRMAGTFIDFPDMIRDSKTKMPIKPVRHSYANYETLLDYYNIEVSYDLMRHQTAISSPQLDKIEGSQETGVAYINSLLRKNGLAVEAGKDNLVIARSQNQYHPVARWINWTAHPLDHKDRIRELWETIALAPDYPEELGLELLTRWLISAAKAALVPAGARQGISAQGVLVLQGKQGVGKSRWLESLVPDSEWISTGRQLDPGNRDSVQQATGVWICELGELDSTFRKADIAALKAFVTNNKDTYRTAYERREEVHPRRTVYAATINRADFLMDETGNRRYWIVPCQALAPDHGIDLEQLWLQVFYRAHKQERHWLTPEFEKMLREVHGQHRFKAPVAEALETTYEFVPDGTVWEDKATVRTTVQSHLGLLSLPRRDSLELQSALREMCAEWKGSTLPRKVKGVRTWPVRRLGTFSILDGGMDSEVDLDSLLDD